MTAAVELRNISKSFGETQTLRDVSLSIRPGEFISLVGPSGCGKSTLLRILAGLAPQSSGTISIDGAEVDYLPPSARDIAMVFQSYALYPHMTVGQNIATPLRMRQLPAPARLPVIGRIWPGQSAKRARIEQTVIEAARLVEIEAMLDRKPAALSGGQRQRVALARAIVRRPRVFLMDEPLSNLDARLRVTMRAEIAALHQRLGATFIYVTHDQVEAMTMSDRVAVMMGGEIVQCAAPTELYDNPRDLRVARFVGSPEIATISSDELIAANEGFATLLPHTPVIAAFRPETVSLVPVAGHLEISATLQRVEQLGHEILVFLRLAGGARLTVRAAAANVTLPAAGQRLSVWLPRRTPMLFDADGARIFRARHGEPAHAG
ncbi:ABC transporter ATP-binding protein [Paracoccus siganidrum]|uniref:ABC transporter ATP-binding protein n=1 Tax=Paracoccus siganidrum TaxID=1276757 RepID=A0A418ZYX5_9RHOB|nr:ABC transporter ATP-binding protein [Paracoccus siganidrum]RJL05723.1 ABC transporter ATP-binding protein [Paracoccus siganidrum]RMC26994.1 glycerol-3-phosphate ABC transporter ATP-binding protein [Paracoccus siganidrum]